MSTARDGLAGYPSYRGINGEAYEESDATGNSNWVTDAPSNNAVVVITDLWVSVGAAARVGFFEESTNHLVGRMDFAAAGSNQFTPRSKIRLAPGKRLRVTTDDSVYITVLALYTFEGANAPL